MCNCKKKLFGDSLIESHVNFNHSQGEIRYGFTLSSETPEDIGEIHREFLNIIKKYV